MKKQLLLVTMFVAGMFSATTLYAQSVYYVQSAKAKILSGSSFKSTVIAVVGKGHQLTSIGREGSWVKVKIDDKEGYVPSLLLSAHPPLEKARVIKADDTEIKTGVRRKASSFTSAAAARGKAGIIKADGTEIRQGVRPRASSFTSAAAAQELTHEDQMRMITEERVGFSDEAGVGFSDEARVSFSDEAGVGFNAKDGVDFSDEEGLDFNDEAWVDFSAIERMESLALTSDEVTQFMAGGKP